MSSHVLLNTNKVSSETKHLQSEIINQKKQFIFKVEQTSDFVYPNENYKYYIYLKNISGVDVNNIHVIVNNASDILIDEEGQDLIEIGTMKDGEVKMIYLNASCQSVGTFYTHFICYGDGTGLFYKTMKIHCSYNNISDALIHRIHIYNFTPYEDTYTMSVDDFNNQVTQLFKTQKLPYRAGEHPFNYQAKEDDSTIKPFSNTESESFIAQHDEKHLKGFADDNFEPKEIYEPARNTKEHYYQYIGRENFNENSLETFEGKNLFNIIQNINENSQYFKATFLKTGNNTLLNDFKEYNPNGFIYRFGLLSSEIYHHLGVLPTYSYMSDYLFRWAPSKDQPLNLIPQKRAMNWNRHKWAGHGWRVYRIATEDYMNTDEWKESFAKGEVERWSIIEDFENIESAKSYVERQKTFDETIKSQLSLSYDKYDYLIRESFYDNGVFFVNIPLDKIPANFNLLPNEDIEAIVQKTKPFGVKPLIRYTIERIFDQNMEFIHYPKIKPYIEIDMGDMDEMTYFIQSKKYDTVTEKICGEDISSTKLVPFGKTVLYNGAFEGEMNFFKEGFYPRVVASDIKTSLNYLHQKYPCPHISGQNCSYGYACMFKSTNGKCLYGQTEKNTPDVNIELDMEQEPKTYLSNIENQLITLSDLKDILYQNNAENLGFNCSYNITNKPNLTAASSENNFITDWAKNNDFKSMSFKISESEVGNKKGFTFDQQNIKQTYNIVKIPIINRDSFNYNNYEIGLGVLDSQNKYHYLSAKYDSYENMDYIKYATSFNNNYRNKKDGFQKINALAICIIPVGYKKIILFMVEDETKLHYFNHIITTNVSDIFIFMSDKLLTTKNNVQQVISSFFTCGYIDDARIALETPFVNSNKIYNYPIIEDGDNWTNLYRIDKAESSYTYIHNTSNTSIQPSDITLHFDNINIPDNCIIKDIKLNTLINTSSSLNVQCLTGLQGNNNFNDALSNQIIFEPNSIECYPSNKESQYYYKDAITIAETNDNQKLLKELKSNYTKDQLFNEAINISTQDYIGDYNKYFSINKGFWIELSDFTYNQNNCNNINNMSFVIEGFNYGPEIDLSYQLLCLQESAERNSIKINSGYFYEKIPLKFLNSFVMDELRLRFKFDGLNNEINVFNTAIEFDFKNKESQYIDFIMTDDIAVNKKQNINLNCFDDSFEALKLNNGVTIKLQFDELNPGDFYRIYFAELEIIYQETDMNLLINKNAFEFIEHENNFLSISGQVKDAYLSGEFYDNVATVSQLESTIDADNHGVELKDTIYQSFIAQNNDITGIEIFPNGFVGSPSDTIKIGIYTNHGNTPNRLIKEVYANGWTKSNDELKNLYSIKYNLNIDNLKIGEQYWIKIQVENPTDNSFYLLRYTTEKQKDQTMLLMENNDYINTFGCLEFNIYSRNLTRSFNQLPTVQDYFNNPCILIGLHKGVGEITNLKVKRGSLNVEEQ